MFDCLKKITPFRQIETEIYEAEIQLLQWQRNAEDQQANHKKALAMVEAVEGRLKRLRAHKENYKEPS